MPNVVSFVERREICNCFTTLSKYLSGTVATSEPGKPLELDQAVNSVMARARHAHASGNKLIFVGNGGSAAITSHIATGYSKDGGIRSLALNDSSMLTCLATKLIDQPIDLAA